jgi:hypothetical protein
MQFTLAMMMLYMVVFFMPFGVHRLRADSAIAKYRQY